MQTNKCFLVSYIIIFMSCCKLRFLIFSLGTRLYHRSLPVGFLEYILYSYRAVLDKFFVSEGALGRRSIMSSSLLLQQCSACLFRLIWMVFEIGYRYPYSFFFVGCCFQDFLNIALNILLQFAFSFLSKHLVIVMHPYIRTDTTAAWKILRFILLNKFDFYMINNLSIADHAFP